ncbi:MAG: efflux transporter periplasmic adaptor subunit [Planctomycetes bacterium SCN 63-9]|nr:MAG: efflux transporter periplasmic adaptor subunit [Planctomycetes bacterium SCN 63-9]
MKRFIALGAAMGLAALIIGAAVAAARPDWLPAAIRSHLPLVAKLPETPPEEAGLYCKEHGVPEKFCTLCHEELNKTLKLCDEHGNIPEDICTQCHPDLEKKYNIGMCPKGHGLPKEFCFKCGKANSASATLPDDGWCVTHGKPEALCLECKSDPKSHDASGGGVKVCRQPLPTVKLGSAKLASQVGLQTAEVVEESHAHKLNANAETAYDANRYAEITPRVTGFLKEVRADLGKAVKQGDVLAVVDSADVSGVKAQYLTAQAAQELARATYNRIKMLSQSGAVPAKTELESLTALNQAKASMREAEQKLKNYGFDEPQLDRIIKENDTNSSLAIVAPLDGTVVVRHAVRGEPVQSTTPIFSIADTSRMWLWIDVYESDISVVKPDQKVTFSVSGNDFPASTGTLNWVGTEVNQQTRTTRVRAELSNPEGKLRANQFGQAEIQIGEEHKAVIVPKVAVQRKDGVDVVFLPQEEGGVYRPQRVVAKPTSRGEVLEVTWGLKPGQRVVTKGAFLLKTEIMKGAIGAGCCE